VPRPPGAGSHLKKRIFDSLLKGTPPPSARGISLRSRQRAKPRPRPVLSRTGGHHSHYPDGKRRKWQEHGAVCVSLV
jgi:hypothetical protein